MIGGAETLASKLALLPQQATTVVECPVSLLRGSLLPQYYKKPGRFNSKPNRIWTSVQIYLCSAR
jgi:hypothetical protein